MFTPSYEDDPLSNLEFLKTLNQEEIILYVRGYVQACIHMREALSKGTIDLLTLTLQTENKAAKQDLEHSVAMLDIYVSLIKAKESALVEMFPEISRNTVEP